MRAHVPQRVYTWETFPALTRPDVMSEGTGMLGILSGASDFPSSGVNHLIPGKETRGNRMSSQTRRTFV